MPRPRIPLRDRLTRFLNAPIETLSPTACWTWYGALNRFMPTVRVDGRHKSARRAIYEEFVRPLDIDEKLVPVCQYPACVNPAHAMVVRVAGLTPPDLAPDEIFAIPEDTGMTADELADIIVGMDSHDPDTLARELDLSVESISEALGLLGGPTRYPPT